MATSCVSPGACYNCAMQTTRTHEVLLHVSVPSWL